MMEKIYCKPCKHLFENIQCRHPSNLLEQDDWYEPKKRTKEHPCFINAGNNCPNFEPEVNDFEVKFENELKEHDYGYEGLVDA